MRRFAQLLTSLEASRRTHAKVRAMAAYFADCPARDAAWALWFLMGKKLRTRISGKQLLQWSATLTGLQEWLIQLCYEKTGDSAETVSLLLPQGPGIDFSLADFVEQHLLPLGDWDAGFQLNLLRNLWQQLDRPQMLLCNKMLTGGLRVGVSRTLVVKALAQAHGLQAAVVQHRLMGSWQPSPLSFLTLIGQHQDPEAERSRPYPFMLAAPLDGELANVQPLQDWQVEWKWDGMRAQLIKRQGYIQLWSRGEEPMAEAFPELIQAAARVPGNFVLDGEILCWQDGAANPDPFSTLQSRITRKRPSESLLRDFPTRFLAYDCLELSGEDVRIHSLRSRRLMLEKILPAFHNGPSAPILQCSPVIYEADGLSKLMEIWRRARDFGTEGFMLKRLDSPYTVGRVRGCWWKFKSEPYTVDLVMVYAQAGHGKRGGLYTDYTLAALHEGQFVPVAKAYSGLDDAEIRAVNDWIHQHTLAKHGPVRVVQPELVFEIAFEGIQLSKRHRAGIALRFPRIHRWRKDKPALQADTLDVLTALLAKN